MPNSILVAIAQQLKIDPEFHKNAAMLMNTDIVFTPHTISRSSFSVLAQIVDRESNKTLAQCQRQLVYIDTATRRALPLPDSYRQNFTADPAGEPSRIPVLEIRGRGRYFRHDLRVQHSDIDSYRHVNQSVYLRYCLDAAATASSDGMLEYFEGDVMGRKLRRADMLYKGECTAGDDLMVCVWEDKNEQNEMHFLIFKEEEVVFSCSLQFLN